MKLEDLKQGIGSVWDSVADGWQNLRESAGSALTRFQSKGTAELPTRDEVDDQFYFPAQRWSMLGGDVFEDERRLIVRLEVPGMEKENLSVEVAGDRLTVSGEKGFERETTEGRWRSLQCAYGTFRRVVPLATPVAADAAKATYRNGVLRIELPKLTTEKPQRLMIKVD